MFRKIFLLFLFLSILITPGIVSAQFKSETSTPAPSPLAGSQDATSSAKNNKVEQKQIDLTSPEEAQARKEFTVLFLKRPINEPNFLNFMGYTVQYAVRSGVPVNTIILILLLPFLATSVVFFRHIVGIPTLEMLVPIALSITLVATGLRIGAILLLTILFASIVSRIILKKIRIMQLPKMALSMFLVALSVFIALTASASLGLFEVGKLSFLPVLLLILLSDKIVALQLARGSRPAIVITFFTLLLGALGYAMLSFAPIRNFILLYPEIILILIPLNIALGRYFGLRLTEYHRFSAFRRYVNQ